MNSADFPGYPASRPGRGPPKKGFTLLEVLMVLLCIGILSATGIRFYAGVVRETRWNTRKDAMEAFLTACQRRASDRGLPVSLEVSERLVAIAGSPNVALSLEGFDGATRQALSGIRFTAGGLIDRAGNPVREIAIASEGGGGKGERFSFVPRLP